MGGVSDSLFFFFFRGPLLDYLPPAVLNSQHVARAEKRCQDVSNPHRAEDQQQKGCVHRILDICHLQKLRSVRLPAQGCGLVLVIEVRKDKTHCQREHLAKVEEGQRKKEKRLCENRWRKGERKERKEEKKKKKRKKGRTLTTEKIMKMPM